jgi:hypothetical protein
MIEFQTTTLYLPCPRSPLARRPRLTYRHNTRLGRKLTSGHPQPWMWANRPRRNQESERGLDKANMNYLAGYSIGAILNKIRDLGLPLVAVNTIVQNIKRGGNKCLSGSQANHWSTCSSVI